MGANYASRRPTCSDGGKSLDGACQDFRLPSYRAFVLSNIHQFLQDRLKRKASFAEKYAGSQLGLITLIGPHETHPTSFALK